MRSLLENQNEMAMKLTGTWPIGETTHNLSKKHVHFKIRNFINMYMQEEQTDE
jgi:hypothetical protein